MVDSPNISWHHLKFPLIWMPTKNNAPSSLEKGWRDWYDDETMMGHSTWFDFFSSDKGTSPPSIRICRWSCQWGMIGCTVFLGPSGTFRTFKEGPIWDAFFFVKLVLEITRCLTFSKVYHEKKHIHIWEQSSQDLQDKCEKLSKSQYLCWLQRTPTPSSSPVTKCKRGSWKLPLANLGAGQLPMHSPPHQSRGKFQGPIISGTPIPILPIPLPCSNPLKYGLMGRGPTIRGRWGNPSTNTCYDFMNASHWTLSLHCIP